METKLLNLMLYRQTLLQKHLWNQIKEIQMQLQIQKSFLAELKDATNYFKSEFGQNELAGFPTIIGTEVNMNVDTELYAGRHPAECLE